jgi:hypothetical protein
MIFRLIFVKVDGASRKEAVETATGVITIFASPSQSDVPLAGPCSSN